MNEIDHLLSCLAEECAEVAKEACKALRFGLEDRNCMLPEPQPTNAQKIAAELNDLMGIKEMLEERGLIPRSDVDEAIKRKKARVAHFMEYARSVGQLDKETVISLTHV